MRASLTRQVRGELRKTANPIVAGAVVVVAAYAAFSQLRVTSNLCAPAPTPLDLTGSARIAIDQHITLLGFALAGIIAGYVTAEEAESGAIDQAFLASSSRVRIWLARVLAVLMVLVVSTVLTTVAVRISGHWIDWPAGCSLSPRSNALGMLGDAGSGVVIVLFAAVLATVFALVTRSTVITVLATVAVLVLPTAIHSETLTWLFPTKWIVDAAHLTDHGGGGIDYTLSYQSGYNQRGLHSVVAIVLLLAVTAVLSWLGLVLLQRRRAGAQVCILLGVLMRPGGRMRTPRTGGGGGERVRSGPDDGDAAG